MAESKAAGAGDTARGRWRCQMTLGWRAVETEASPSIPHTDVRGRDWRSRTRAVGGRMTAAKRMTTQLVCRPPCRFQSSSNRGSDRVRTRHDVREGQASEGVEVPVLVEANTDGVQPRGGERRGLEGDDRVVGQVGSRSGCHASVRRLVHTCGIRYGIGSRRSWSTEVRWMRQGVRRA